MFQNQTVVTVEQLCEQTKNQGTGHFKWVHCMVMNYISIKLTQKYIDTDYKYKYTHTEQDFHLAYTVLKV